MPVGRMKADSHPACRAVGRTAPANAVRAVRVPGGQRILKWLHDPGTSSVSPAVARTPLSTSLTSPPSDFFDAAKLMHLHSYCKRTLEVGLGLDFRAGSLRRSSLGSRRQFVSDSACHSIGSSVVPELASHKPKCRPRETVILVAPGEGERPREGKFNWRRPTSSTRINARLGGPAWTR